MRKGGNEVKSPAAAKSPQRLFIILDRLCEIKAKTRNLASPTCKTSAPRATELCNAKGDEEEEREEEEVAALFSLPTIHAWELKEAAIFLSLTDLGL